MSSQVLCERRNRGQIREACRRGTILGKEGVAGRDDSSWHLKLANRHGTVNVMISGGVRDSLRY